MRRSKKAAIGAGTALAAVALAFVMLGVGNVPSYSSSATCGAGQTCTPASITTGTGTFNVVDAGAVYTSILTTPVVDAGTVIVATGNNLCLDGPPCSVAIMNNTGQMVFSAPVAGGRFPGSLTAQGTTTLGSAFADYITVVGGSSGVGTTITAVSDGSNSPINLVPKGTGAVTVTGKTTTTSLAIGSGAAVSAFHEFSAVIDVASITAGGCQDNAITATGAVIGDSVIPAWPDEMQNVTSTTGFMFVDQANSITVRLCNVSGVAENPSSATYGGFWVHHQ